MPAPPQPETALLPAAVRRALKAAQRYLRTPEAKRFIDEAAVWLHRGSLDDALDFYESISRHPPQAGCIQALGLVDRFYLLTVLLNRHDLIVGGTGAGRRREAQDWIYARCREVEHDPNGFLDLWAREHGKSSIITFGGSIQEVLIEPETTEGIFSHTRGHAKGFLRQIKQEFEQNARLKGLYDDVLWANPQREAPKWSEDDGIVVKRKGNPKEATIEAWGLVDGQPTGKHFRLRMYDDVVVPESVTTGDMIRKTTESWEMSNNLGMEGGIERYAGTLYKFGDTYSIMMERQAVKVRLHPATKDGTKNGAPVFFDQATWDDKKRKQPTTLAAQLLLNPAAGAEAELPIGVLRHFFVRPRTINVYIMGDPSKGRRKSADNTAIVVIGVDSRGNKFFLDGACHRMNLAERWDRLSALRRKWKAADGVMSVKVGWEQFGLVTDIEHFEDKMDREKDRFEIEELSWPRDGDVAKDDRIRRMVPDFLQGTLYVPAVVHHETHGLSYWRAEGQKIDILPVEDKADTDEMRKMRRKLNLPVDPPEWLDAIARGTQHLIQKPIKVLERGDAPRVYDLTRAFLGEAQFFPYGSKRDLIDATSRIYDMEPLPAAPPPTANARPVYPD